MVLEKKNRKKIIIGAVAAVGVVGASYSWGSANASTELGKEKVKYEEMTDKVSKKKKELDLLDKKLRETAAKLDEKSKAYQDAKKMIAQRDDAQNEKEELTNEISTKKEELKEVKNEINDKNKELSSVTGQIQEKKEAPKVFSAGQYIVGQDFPEGRYKAVPVGQGSNFFIYGSDGSATVNTILGSSADGNEPEYVFYTSEGDIMRTEAQIKLIPVK
ncbi:hypothetical protein [Bacillus sonorensis]|uniref:hypothetical protein n=1 Tax=Bacillus sonorensis TaxID=119858 RepID=UPI002118D702|nr:hypothetical protein [Bacillus sonorensis]